MKSRIYKIENDINNKVYIGKTTLSLEERFAQHCREIYREQEKQRPLYSAMLKYGVEHFSISLIEECPSDIDSEREQYWIGYFKDTKKDITLREAEKEQFFMITKKLNPF